jgi:methyl-accepting chemotaxis protein/methyl-accepting chemotaxis protein-1 (serine sensor receptor)
LRSRPTSSRSTPRWKQRAPAKRAWASRSSPTKSAISRSDHLAQRSAQAAKDTAGLIEESITKAQGGSQKVKQVETAITGITASVKQVKTLVEEVSAASQQQAQGIDQVSHAIAQMEKVTQTTAATAEESAAASEELSAQADTTMTIVARLEALVGSKGRAAAASRAAADEPIASGVVVKMPAGKPTVAASAAERAIPLERTGTFGSF